MGDPEGNIMPEGLSEKQRGILEFLETFIAERSRGKDANKLRFVVE